MFSDKERDIFLSHEIIVEEKIDGANLGISFDYDGSIQLQNRGSIISEPYMGQWKKISDWLERNTDGLFDAIGARFILFGEWCYAKHSIAYNELPDWFIGFDVFELDSRKFLATEYRDALLSLAKIPIIAELARGHFQLEELSNLMKASSYSEYPCEGLYLRIDDGKWLTNRAKLVRPEFVQAIDTHWSKKKLQPNQLVQTWS